MEVFDRDRYVPIINPVSGPREGMTFSGWTSRESLRFSSFFRLGPVRFPKIQCIGEEARRCHGVEQNETVHQVKGKERFEGVYFAAEGKEDVRNNIRSHSTESIQ